ncbi:DNA methyltransferase [Methylococcus capsulatus]|uniref:DNA methyltransferase n=1 Tax=Methylococcus capsulatus TaxID=414 RepID=UPI0002EB2681|nr:DNA methyltransferase [Methylococcus capsulatus]
MNDLLQSPTTNTGPVECLGQTFSSDQARREHFLRLLAEKLKDPEFRKQEGFPQGTDEAILAMSDPPYYTACPNPWLADFVKHYGKPYDPSVKYSREPLAIDVSVGKTDPIYKAHSYHTKVPHLAIVPSILHYTQPGDIVLDGFAGSGMTGVAAQWCASAPAAYRHELEMSWKKEGKPAPKWGARRVILNDLSPAATFIAANYNLPFDVEDFAKAGKQLLKKVEQEIGWMYETLHTDGKTKGRIEYTVWSEIFTCPECAGEVNFLDEALIANSNEVRDAFPCPSCGVELTKKRLDRLYVKRRDPATGANISTPKRVPTLISYSIGKTKHVKKPSAQDIALIERFETMALPQEVPVWEFPYSDMWEAPRMRDKGITHTHHLYSPRARLAIAAFWKHASAITDVRIKLLLKFWLDSHLVNLSILNRYRPEVSFPYNPLTGSYYVPSLISEASPFIAYENKLKRIVAAMKDYEAVHGGTILGTSSTTGLALADASVDYIFTDPPFGDNIPYAELNFLAESWHGVVTRAELDAIVDRSKENRSAQKSVDDYRHLMKACFAEYYRVLKPGRWMTVVFSNTKASVWNSLQTAMQEAGFVVANVSALDKQQGSFKAVTTTVAVKQDLVISAYKPNGGLEQRFSERGATQESAWDFVQTHLRQLPVAKIKAGQLEFIAERDPRILFDRMVAWFVRHSAAVPLSSPEFQEGLYQRFPERDGMVFLPEQVAEYDKKRAQVAQAPQMELFVSDERSAIDWLTDFLKKRPSTYQELHPEFITQLGAGWKKHEKRPELAALLEANFLQYDGTGDVPSQIHSYLSTNHKDLRGLDKSDRRLIAKAKDRWYVPDPNKAQDLEKKREKVLLKEFDTYLAATGRRLKEFRLEVLRAGFKDAWSRKDYQTIIKVAQKIPDEALQEDEKLLLWYDQALTRTEADA